MSGQFLYCYGINGNINVQFSQIKNRGHNDCNDAKGNRPAFRC